MFRTSVATALILGSLCLSETLTFAHHSVAVNFDQSKSVDVTGKIKELLIRNPHSQVTLEVARPEGGVTEFFVEWSDSNSLVRRKIPYDLLKVGDTVTITVMPSRRLPNLGYFSKAVLPDGRTLRDCGFTAFRQSVANGTAVTCEAQ